MNSLTSFINSLNLPFSGDLRGDQYFITLNNSNDFSTAFNIISLNDDLRANDGSIATDDKTEFRYTDGMYDVLLQADYTNDIYSVLIEEK